MYAQDIIRILGHRANDVLNDTFKLMLDWPSLCVKQRAAYGLTILHRLNALSDDLADVADVFNNAFPTVSLAVLQQWKNKLWEIMPYADALSSFEEKSTADITAFLDSLEIHDESRVRVKEIVRYITENEDAIEEALPAAVSHIMDMVLNLEALTHEDRTKHNALLYTNALGRYYEDHWKANGKRELRHKIRNHCPWDYPASEDDLKSLYKELYDDFIQTPLGAIYEETSDDELVLANAIAQSGCKAEELQKFFHDHFMLQDLARLIAAIHKHVGEDKPSITVIIENLYTNKVENSGTLINNPGAAINLIDQSDQDNTKEIVE